MDKPIWLWRRVSDILTWEILIYIKKIITRGILIGFREAVKYKIKARYADKNGRYIVLDVVIDNNPVILVNCYGPNVESDQLKILDELAHILNQLQISENTTFIWGGNFNLFFDVYLDALGGSRRLKVKSLSKLLSMMSENDLCDIYRIRNPTAKRFTWRRKSPYSAKCVFIFFCHRHHMECFYFWDLRIYW